MHYKRASGQGVSPLSGRIGYPCCIVPTILNRQYQALKAEAARNLAGLEVAQMACDMALRARFLLAGSERVALTSATEKQYFHSVEGFSLGR